MKWDFDNRLLAADSDNNGSDDVFYLWDALGRRVGRTAGGSTTVYFQNGQQTLADYASGNPANSPTHNYLWGSYIDELVLRTSSSGNHYFHRNQQYSIIAATTSAGAIAERYAYTAYGELTILNASGTPIAASAINNRYTYTGREWDAVLAIYHFRARMYSPLAGRFISRDPIGYVVYSGSYQADYLIRMMDPLGLYDVDPRNTTCGRGWDDHWWRHYFHGMGRPLDLSSIPSVFDLWKNSSLTQQAFSGISTIADSQTGNACGTSATVPIKTEPIAVDYSAPTTGSDIETVCRFFQSEFPRRGPEQTSLWPIGDTRLRLSGSCSCSTSCETYFNPRSNNCITGRPSRLVDACTTCACVATVSLKDSFEDVMDPLDRSPQIMNEFPGGKAYAITASLTKNSTFTNCQTRLPSLPVTGGIELLGL